MKNLKPSKKNPIDVYNDILSAKKDKDLVSRLSLLSPIVKKRYSVYKAHYSKNTLEELSPYLFDENQKNDFRKLYSSKSTIIQEIKREITVTDINRIINTCQNCTINGVNSLDHYLPKTSFHEFIVNPKNLFPSCSECNTFKGKFWKFKNKRLFLNLYLDYLPKEQYLFVKIDDSGHKNTFFLKNNGNIDVKLFEIIESHYERLHLLERFRVNCSDVVVELVNLIKASQSNMPLENLIETITSAEVKSREAFGFNYWKSILKTALINDKNFLDANT